MIVIPESSSLNECEDNPIGNPDVNKWQLPHLFLRTYSTGNRERLRSRLTATKSAQCMLEHSISFFLQNEKNYSTTCFFSGSVE